MDERVKKLFEEIKNAQDNNKNQSWYETELNKLWYSWNPFKKEINHL